MKWIFSKEHGTLTNDEHKGIHRKSVPFRKRLSAGRVPVNKKHLTDTVPANKENLTGTVPKNKEHLTGTLIPSQAAIDH